MQLRRLTLTSELEHSAGFDQAGSSNHVPPSVLRHWEGRRHDRPATLRRNSDCPGLRPGGRLGDVPAITASGRLACALRNSCQAVSSCRPALS